MRWGDMRESQNVEDRTGQSMGGGGGFPLGGGGVKLGGGALILMVIVGLIFGINPLDMLSGGGPQVSMAPTSPPPGYGPQTAPGGSAYGPSGQPRAPAQAAPDNDPRKALPKRVLGDTEDVWSAVFQAAGKRYTPPTLTLFRGRVSSACGTATAAAGPFYCSGDRHLYLDTNFFDELSGRFGAPGDFAQAYVIAHEVGHHVQTLLGSMDQFEAQMQRTSGAQRNAWSVRLELQADCYAGVWAFYAAKRGLIDSADVEGGLRAAAAVGDDQIQKAAQGYARPESFTHGSAQQRMRWFRAGLASGNFNSCDTLRAREV